MEYPSRGHVAARVAGRHQLHIEMLWAGFPGLWQPHTKADILLSTNAATDQLSPAAACLLCLGQQSSRNQVDDRSHCELQQVGSRVDAQTVSFLVISLLMPQCLAGGTRAQQGVSQVILRCHVPSQCQFKLCNISRQSPMSCTATKLGQYKCHSIG